MWSMEWTVDNDRSWPKADCVHRTMSFNLAYDADRSPLVRNSLIALFHQPEAELGDHRVFSRVTRCSRSSSAGRKGWGLVLQCDVCFSARPDP
jgi:hypothetical protein